MRKLRAGLVCVVMLGGCAPSAFDSTANERNAVRDGKPNDVTAFVQTVGEPLKARYPGGSAVYARNIWDLHAWDGRLYLGHGNSSNIGPYPNAGPIDVWSYSPGTNTFTNEYTVEDEQIDHYSEVNGRLAIAGHDPRESWALGNFYRLEPSGWVKHRTIFGGVHTYDVLGQGGAIFAATGTHLGAIVQRSLDDGRTWSLLHTPGWRVYSLFELDGRVHASTDYNGIYRFSGEAMEPVPFATLFPGLATTGREVIVVRSTNLRDGLAYIAGELTNDHQWLPAGLFVAPEAGAARALLLPSGAVARDLEVLDGKLFVLASRAAEAEGRTLNFVYAANGLGSFREVLHFESETFARSFAFLNGDVYFGLGCEVSPLSPATGRILRVTNDRFSR